MVAFTRITLEHVLGLDLQGPFMHAHGDNATRIWSDEHKAWWRPNGAGYTVLIYTFNEASRHATCWAREKDPICDRGEPVTLHTVPVMVFNTHGDVNWTRTPALTARLKALWAGGMVTREMARVLSREFQYDITHNMCIGAVRRLKLKPRPHAVNGGGKVICPARAI